ncbi:MAG TPA: B-box zinc finger protein [Candidatus Hydrogenedens sp.]|nr:B-box zinc finger protein [Candidatus Hydrogenedens sp.]HOK10237.1 B-box zinc finger protein [Candidatus Hydrogenedens sp.]HOL20033.1 B-box zinc finger protein [Candidatus Hydrogenedens sp.]HPP59784.1 B-box zinc finger protein [Candidatus Hydrogenedens sp.]
MLDGRLSSCINHPSVSATARCKQCGKPVCGACVVSSPLGSFCSEACRERFETFAKRVQELDRENTRARWNIGVKLRQFFSFLIVVIVVLVTLGVIGTLFNIPILSQWVFVVRAWIGI